MSSIPQKSHSRQKHHCQRLMQQLYFFSLFSGRVFSQSEIIREEGTHKKGIWVKGQG
jgi:hypothetical protein